MAANAVAVAPERSVADLNALMPYASVSRYFGNQVIYDRERPLAAIYRVMRGRVRVSRWPVDGRQVLVDVYRAGDLFGEGALIGAPSGSEQAVAVEETHLMSWSPAGIDAAILREPSLGIALLRALLERGADFERRLESQALDNVQRRLARALLRFGERLGDGGRDGAQDGKLVMPPLTHVLLSRYVGTTREIITHYMSQFRRQGLVRYSRAGIAIDRAAMNTWLRAQENGAFPAKRIPE